MTVAAAVVVGTMVAEVVVARAVVVVVVVARKVAAVGCVVPAAFGNISLHIRVVFEAVVVVGQVAVVEEEETQFLLVPGAGCSFGVFRR